MDTVDKLQAALIKTLRANGTLHSASIEDAFRKVPRHPFLPNEPLESVYSDIAIAVKRSETGRWTSSSSQPSMMAIMLEQLGLERGQRVLEIGAGSGYNAALIAEIVGPEGSVVTVDIQPDLIDQARRHLDETGYQRVRTVAADGAAGFMEGAPYDRIILTAASWVITPAWREQLVEGGRLVLPLDLGMVQKSVAFERHGDELISLSLYACGFMSLQGAYAAPFYENRLPEFNDRVTLVSQQTLPVDIESFARWLKAPGAPLPSGIHARTFDIMSDLLLWLRLQSNGTWAHLTVDGDLAVEQHLPVLIAWAEDGQHTEAIVYFDQHSAAALLRPSSSGLHWTNWNLPDEEQPPDQPFEIGVLPLGPNPQIARDIVTRIQKWADQGRPSTNQIRLRAVPAEKTVQVTENEYLIDRLWTKLVLWYG